MPCTPPDVTDRLLTATRPVVQQFLVLLVLAGGLWLPVAQRAAAQAVDGPLERQHVRDYIRLRIETHQLQQKMKANADQYDSVIQAFYERRAALLKQEGWSADAFDALQKRIMHVESALETVADSAEYRAERREQLESIEQSTHMTEAQKKQMRAQVARQDSIRQAQLIEPTRRDWPAVRPYLDALEHLTDYVAQNRSDPPSLDALPPAN